jgi:ComF family protein
MLPLARFHRILAGNEGRRRASRVGRRGFSEMRCVFSQSVFLTSTPANPVPRGIRKPEVPPSEFSVWRAVVRVLRSSAVGALDSFSSVIFPSDCRVCGLPLAGFTLLPVCESCWNDLPAQKGPLCARCGELLSLDWANPDGEELCRPCRVAPPDFVRAVAHGVYGTKLRSLLHLLKYDGIEGLARPLGALLADPVLAIPDLPEGLVAVPVPLFGRRHRKRGFNQSERLARGLMAALRRRRPEVRIKLAAALLMRRRETQSQAGLNPHERRRNVRGAFFVPRPEMVAGRNVLLVDDIYTTGATARACSTALAKAGAGAVWVATVARAQVTFARRPAGLDSGKPAAVELPMEEDFVYWEETDRPADTGGELRSLAGPAV